MITKHFSNLKRNLLLTAALLIVMSCITPFIMAADTNTRVFDQAGILSDQEIAQLEQSVSRVKAEYPLDVVIVTTNDTNGKSSMVYADDFYDEHGFGYKDTYDGILFLINMQSRELYISTDANAKSYFTDERIQDMISDISPYLTNEDYYDGCQCFLTNVCDYMDQGISVFSSAHKPFTDRYNKPLSPRSIALSAGMAAIAALIISLIIRAAITYSYKHPHFTTPDTVPDTGSVHYTEKEDHFITTHTSRVRRNSDSHSGGGSSSHMSSGGHSHGGGGGSF